MSSKASEILGVSSGHPQLSRRRDAPSRDGVTSRASQVSRYTSQTLDGSFDSDSYAPSHKRPKTGRNRLHKSDRSVAPSSKTSIDSIQPSVRFADSSLSSRTSTSTLRNATDYETALPAISRRPPSAWRGLSSKGSNLWKPVSARQSEESMTSWHTKDSSNQPYKNKSLFQSALSRFGLRSPKSQSSSRDQPSRMTSTASTARSSAAPSAASSAMPSAYTSAYATPRALSPTRPIVRRAEPSESSQVSTSASQARKPKRINSRMPVDAPRHIDVHRPTSRNWVDELDDLDVDDGQVPGRYVAEDVLRPVPHSNHTAKSSRDFARVNEMAVGGVNGHAWNAKPVVNASHPTADPRSQAAPQGYTTWTQKTKRRSIESAKKHHSKRNANVSSSHSILSLSDSDGDNSVILRDTGQTYRQTVRPLRKVHGSITSLVGMDDTGRTSKAVDKVGHRREAYKAPAAILSVLRLEDERDDSTASTSLPSLVGSSSSRQNSSISATSYSRSFVSDAQQIPNFSVPRGRRVLSKEGKSAHARSPTNEHGTLYQNLQAKDKERPVSVIAVAPSDSNETSTNIDSSDSLIMASISREEAALLAHIRRQRAQALDQLQPQSPTPETAEDSIEDSDKIHFKETDDLSETVPEASDPKNMISETRDGAFDIAETPDFQEHVEDEPDDHNGDAVEISGSEEAADHADETIMPLNIQKSHYTNNHQRNIRSSEDLPEDIPKPLNNTEDTVVGLDTEAQDHLDQSMEQNSEQDYDPTDQHTFIVLDGKSATEDAEEQITDDQKAYQHSFSTNDENIADTNEQIHSAESVSEEPTEDEQRAQNSGREDARSITCIEQRVEQESEDTSPISIGKPSPLQGRPPPLLLLHQRQRSIAYREARSKFEQSSQTQTRTSMLPVRRKRDSLTSTPSGSPASATRPSKEQSHIPRLRDSKSASPRPASVINSVDKLPSFQVSDSSSGDVTSAQEAAPDYFPQSSLSDAVSKSDEGVERTFAGETFDSRFESDSSHEASVDTSNAATRHLLGTNEVAAGTTSADDGDDEMAGSALAPVSSIPRPVNRNSGARHVLEAWQALGGGR